MRTVTLGQRGLAVSAIGLGTMGMTMAYGAADPDGGEATIRRALDLGITSLTPPSSVAWAPVPTRRCLAALLGSDDTRS